MATLINERYRLSKECQKLTNAIKSAKLGLTSYKNSLLKRKPFADGAIPLTSSTKKKASLGVSNEPTKLTNPPKSRKKLMSANRREALSRQERRSSPRMPTKMDVAQTETGDGGVANVDVTNVDQTVTAAGGHVNKDLANVDVPPAHITNDNADETEPAAVSHTTIDLPNVEMAKSNVKKKRKRNQGSNASMEVSVMRDKKSNERYRLFPDYKLNEFFAYQKKKEVRYCEC
jgi:hypothetical protein